MSTSVQRVASTLFSAKNWRLMLNRRPAPRLAHAVEGLRARFGYPQWTNRQVVDQAYRELESGYRTEYYYKNLIANKLYVGRHRATNSVMLQELPIGESVADAVFVNGAGTVYEVKTEFDDRSKLNTQLESYYRAFPLVSLVVSASAVDSYRDYVTGGASMVFVKPLGCGRFRF